ncbi:MAG TPA: large conductance mechanosensitive channel protein MscL [Ruminiclostridium sp.]|jgi:large conductance mechanosensitive channel|nr:large-conductance mechanosensitive channel protein MscL [Clostridiaceae bacterium]HAA26257.1 large conductance mechanosensitive channel protein MscL [Ruminiclostridium sp.]
MFKEFKNFAIKGNVLDLAIGVIIGGAFGKIVSSLVNDIIMPLFGVILGKINLTQLKWIVQKADENRGLSELSVMYGNFLQNVVDFLIISFSIFLFVKLLDRIKKKEKEEEEKAPEPPKPSKEEELLTEIRDLLKEKS